MVRVGAGVADQVDVAGAAAEQPVVVLAAFQHIAALRANHRVLQKIHGTVYEVPLVAGPRSVPRSLITLPIGPMLCPMLSACLGFPILAWPTRGGKMAFLRRFFLAQFATDFYQRHARISTAFFITTCIMMHGRISCLRAVRWNCSLLVRKAGCCGTWARLRSSRGFLKEREVGILESIMRKRDQTIAYRTIDGGHPAPYPDMTDEQLYNYEMAFKVPRKTFDRPPSSMKWRASPNCRDPREPYLDESFVIAPSEPATKPSGPASTRMCASSASAAVPNMVEQQPAEAEEAEEAEEAPLFDPSMPAPARSITPERPLPPLDFSRPLRTITTRHPVEIITTRARHPVYKVQAYIGNDEVATVFTIDGRLCENGPRFLENVPQRERVFLNVYATAGAQDREKFTLTQHVSREQADGAAQSGRLACVPIEFDR